MKFFAWISSRETVSYAVSAAFHAMLLMYLAARARPVFQLPTTYGEAQISAIDATWVEPAPIDMLDEFEEIDARVVVTPDRATIDDRDFVPAPSLPEPELERAAPAQAPKPPAATPPKRQTVEAKQPAETQPKVARDSADEPERPIGSDASEPVPDELRPAPSEAAENPSEKAPDAGQPDKPAEQPAPADATAMQAETAADRPVPDRTDAKTTRRPPDRPDPRPPKATTARRAPRRPPPQPSSRSQTAGTQTTEPPRVERNPPPLYPATAVDRGWEGVTTLRIHITSDGLVEQVEVLRSSGFAVLDAAAVRAVQKWRFSPAMRDGKPVPIRVRLKIRFSLN